MSDIVAFKAGSTTPAEITAAFKKFDTNGDGFLSKNEIVKILTRQGGGNALDEGDAEDFAEQYITECDANGDGKVTRDEFARFKGTVRAPWLSNSKFDKSVAKEFSVADADGSGTISEGLKKGMALSCLLAPPPRKQILVEICVFYNFPHNFLAVGEAALAADLITTIFLFVGCASGQNKLQLSGS